MKLEHLPDGSPDCPLIRLYDFDPSEASTLRTSVAHLGSGSSDSVAVHDLPFVTSVDGCQLVLVVAGRDQGVVKAGTPSQFVCVLTRASWKSVVELMEPFCGPEDSKGYQWLDETSDISLLLSPDGLW
jgi:hypothetical protein